MIKSRKYKSKLSVFNSFKLHRMNVKASCLEALILGSLILSSSQSAILCFLMILLPLLVLMFACRGGVKAALLSSNSYGGYGEDRSVDMY